VVADAYQVTSDSRPASWHGNSARPTFKSVSRFIRHGNLIDQLERTCDLAMHIYRQGQDTSEIDAEVDRLLLLLDPEPDE
jgi:hypothetical protein